MKKRRISALLLAVCLLAGMLSVSAGAAEVIAGGDCGYTQGMNHVTWTLDTDGALVITGAGDMEYWVNAGYTDWIDYRGQILTAVIEAGVTDVAPYCFYDCVSLTEVTIPDTVDTINTSAFENCAALTEILIPDTVTSIGVNAFAGCTSLQQITIPDGITMIDRKTFSGCTSLTSVSLPDSVTSLKSNAFSSCTSLTDLVMTEYLDSIGSSAFSGCTGLTVIAIPDNVTSIGNNAFRSCTGLTAVTVGSCVTSVGTGVFAGCSALREITFTGSAPSIGDTAFEGVTATVYYPAEDGSWADVAGQNYGGNLTWTAAGSDAGADAAGSGSTPDSTQFPDDTGTGSWSWASDDIYACTEAGLISAYEDGTFQADAEVTRGVLVESLYRLAGSPAVTGSSGFSDVPAGSTYEAAVLWASENGIVSGYEDGTFRPDSSVTREQLAAFFQRYAAYAGCDTALTADLSGYADAGSISSYAVQPVQWAVSAGLISGRSETTLAPAGTTTRAEAAIILMRFCSWLDSAAAA